MSKFSVTAQSAYYLFSNPFPQSATELSERDLFQWMKDIGIDVYSAHFQSGGIVRGSDLANLDNAHLMNIGITDELHRLIIMECVDELIKGSSSLVST